MRFFSVNMRLYNTEYFSDTSVPLCSASHFCKDSLPDSLAYLFYFFFFLVGNNLTLQHEEK